MLSHPPVNAISEWYGTVEPFRGGQPCAALDLGEIAHVLPSRELAKLLRKDPRVLRFEPVTRSVYLEADNIQVARLRSVENAEVRPAEVGVRSSRDRAG
jgi:hypothetical protein